MSSSHARYEEQRALGTLCPVPAANLAELAITYATQQAYLKFTHQQEYYILRCTIVTWYEAVSGCTSAVRHYITKVWHNHAP